MGSSTILARALRSWRQPGQRGDAVQPVAGMELGELGAEHGVLERGEDPVADELVERHPALERAEAGHHPAAEHCVGGSLEQGLEETGELLGRVLPIAVDHRHHVEALGDGVGVADLLVSPVTLVVGVAKDGEGQLGVRLLVGLTDVEGPIARGVIDDEDLAIPVVEHRPGDPVQHLGERRLCLVGDDEDEESGAMRVGHLLVRVYHSSPIGWPSSWRRRLLTDGERGPCRAGRAGLASAGRAASPGIASSGPARSPARWCPPARSPASAAGWPAVVR